MLVDLEFRVKTEPSARIILFDSHERGDNNINSDRDLLILIDKYIMTHEIKKAVKYPFCEIEWVTGEIISPIIYSKKE